MSVELRTDSESAFLKSHESNPATVHRRIGFLAAVNTAHWLLEQEES